MENIFDLNPKEEIVRGKKWLRPYYYFDTGPHFEITLEGGSLQINPSEFRKTGEKYLVKYNDKEKRFQLIDQGTDRVISNVDFQLNDGYLESDLEVMCGIKSSSPVEQEMKIYLEELEPVRIRDDGFSMLPWWQAAVLGERP